MKDLSAICVIPFYGKSDEWLTWSEKFLVKDIPYGFIDILLGRSIIPKTDEFLMFNTKNKKQVNNSRFE
jgi:hypothetical protein